MMTSVDAIVNTVSLGIKVYHVYKTLLPLGEYVSMAATPAKTVYRYATDYGRERRGFACG